MLQNIRFYIIRTLATRKALVALSVSRLVSHSPLRFLHLHLPREIRDLNRHLSISFMAAILVGTNVVFSTDSTNTNLAQLFPPSPEVTVNIVNDIKQYTPTLDENAHDVTLALNNIHNDYFEQLSILAIEDGSNDSTIGEIGEFYTVEDGDSYAKIAQKVGLRTESLLVANNIDAKKIKTDPNALNLKKGQKIIIPFENLDSGDNLFELAVEAANARKQALADTQSTKNRKNQKTKNNSKVVKVTSGKRDYGTYSGFTAGWCTAWAAKVRPDIGNAIRAAGGGNAGAWGSQARAAGLKVDRNARSGDIVGTGETRYGHVAHVEEDRGGSVLISEMNGAGGRGVVTYREIPKSMIRFAIH